MPYLYPVYHHHLVAPRLVVLDLRVGEVLHHDGPGALPHRGGEVREATVVRVVLADHQDHRVVGPRTTHIVYIQYDSIE